MRIKVLLIATPVLLSILLLQSYLWIPTYEEQTKGNPKRLKEYITASLGDASMLNPILSSDSASSEIEDKVFEGLVDRDKDLSFRGRLAESWETYEIAYFAVNKKYNIPGLGKMDGQNLVEYLRSLKKNPQQLSKDLRSLFLDIRKLELVPMTSYEGKKKIAEGKKEISYQAEAPERIKMVLDQVRQNVFEQFKAILGPGYFKTFDPRDFLTIETKVPSDKYLDIARDILPAKEHNPVLLFHLRPNVHFHDGHVLDAQDVCFTYQAIMNPKNLSPRVSDYEPIKYVQAVDDLTVKVVYKKLYSPALASWSIGILPEHLLNKQALNKEAQERNKDPKNFSLRDSRFNRNPLGCGPFQFQDWKSGQYIILKRFKDYWEGPPNYKKYVFRVIPDLLTQEMEFYAGTLDAYSVQPHQVERLKKDDRFQHFSGVSYGYTYIGYNLRRKIFQDKRVRKALSLAVDVNKIIKYVLYGQGEKITGPFVKQTDYYNDNIEPIGYNPEKALELLKEAGWQPNKKGWLEKDGQRLQFTLITNTGNDIRKSILAIVQDAWKRIGVDVHTDTLEWSVFIQERVNKLDFDALVLGWTMGLEPDLYQIWHSSQTDPYELNFVGFENKKADQLIVKIRKEYDHYRQVQLCHRLHRIIAEEQPYTFLYVSKWTAVLDKRIVIKEKDAQGHIHYEEIQPTKTGDYTFYFNKWVKLPEMPRLTVQGE